jgi:hypothetical protein
MLTRGNAVCMEIGQAQPLTVTRGEHQLPMPIASMGAWFFWSRHDALGLSEEDALAIADGSANPDRLERARVASTAACRTLFNALPATPMRST